MAQPSLGAEIEISICERGCLSRPVVDTATLERRVRALEAERNARRATIEWQFTNRQARVKLKKLYPILNDPRDRGTGASAQSPLITAGHRLGGWR